jgi:hypothetical protein
MPVVGLHAHNHPQPPIHPLTPTHVQMLFFTIGTSLILTCITSLFVSEHSKDAEKAANTDPPPIQLERYEQGTVK